MENQLIYKLKKVLIFVAVFLHLSTNRRFPARFIFFLRFADDNIWHGAKSFKNQNPK